MPRSDRWPVAIPASGSPSAWQEAVIAAEIGELRGAQARAALSKALLFFAGSLALVPLLSTGLIPPAAPACWSRPRPIWHRRRTYRCASKPDEPHVAWVKRSDTQGTNQPRRHPRIPLALHPGYGHRNHGMYFACIVKDGDSPITHSEVPRCPAHA